MGPLPTPTSWPSRSAKNEDGAASLRSGETEATPSAFMPKGINVTGADIGRMVVYRTAPNYAPEQGIITSLNEKYVFVRYGLGSTSAATDPADLDWASGTDTKARPAKRRQFGEPGECDYCERERAKQKDGAIPFFPPHDASPRCESGKHNHCTCDTCF